MGYQTSYEMMRPQVEAALIRSFSRWIPETYHELRYILAYHMGWEGEGAGPGAQGKRIRPVALLLCTQAAGGDWHSALPLAAAVEYIHCFSLMHDDIQDRSDLRRGRLTAWKKWGEAMAINAGDAMFTLAFMTLSEIEETHPPETVVKAGLCLQRACLKLTQGQHLDLSFEEVKELAVEDYWGMVGGKTAALLGCSAELGALAAGLAEEKCQAFYQFGYKIGLAFQVVDDWLGIWGDPAKTGKSTASDLVTGKKTLPILYALNKRAKFAALVETEPLQIDNIPKAVQMLEEDGADTYTLDTASKLTAESIECLEQAVDAHNEAGVALLELAELLTNRKY